MKDKSICDTHCNFLNALYKKMDNKDMECNFYRLLYQLNDPNVRYVLENKIKENWSDIQEYLEQLKKVINYLKGNKNFNNTSIGSLINNIYKIQDNIKTYRTFIKYIPQILDDPNIYQIIKEFLYILSEKKRCKFLVDQNLKKGKLDKNYIKKIVSILGNNLNLLKEFIFIKYEGNNNSWGKVEYESAYKMFKTLNIIDKYFDDPLKLLNIKCNLGKIDSLDDIIENLELNYILKTRKNNLANEKINSVSQFIILMKKKGFNLWYTVDFIMDNVFNNYSLSNISNSIVRGESNIEYQKNNNLLGIKIFILCKKGLISNVNIFQNFSL